MPINTNDWVCTVHIPSSGLTDHRLTLISAQLWLMHNSFLFNRVFIYSITRNQVLLYSLYFSWHQSSDWHCLNALLHGKTCQATRKWVGSSLWYGFVQQEFSGIKFIYSQIWTFRHVLIKVYITEYQQLLDLEGWVWYENLFESYWPQWMYISLNKSSMTDGIS